MKTPELQQNDALEQLVAYCSENRRVVPLPQIWKTLHERLPNRHQKASGGWEPPLPLILSAWHHSSDEDKRGRLHEHLQWAALNGGLEQVERLLKGLAEDDWHHEGD